MSTEIRTSILAAAVLAALLLAPDAALAYGGPGSVISAIGALVAAVAAIVAALFGFVWFPIKRLYRWIRGRGEETGLSREPEPGDEPLQE